MSYQALQEASISTQDTGLSPHLRIAFIGGGNMASAIIRGLIKHGHRADQILVCAPSQHTRSRLVKDFNVKVHSDNSAAVAFADIIILAVKPFIVPLVCEELCPLLAPLCKQKLIVSIAAGLTHASISGRLPQHTQLVCAMPNLPSAIGKGLTGLFVPSHLDRLALDDAEQLMRAVGDTVWLEDETQMASIVATAGSSPAYFFLFLEAMEKAAIAQGLPPKTASKAVLQSAMGAISMAMASKEGLSSLRRQVTSPKGTTEQAVLAFQHGDLDALVAKAMDSAARRAKELALG
ncbi:pyrroline-5-carboxylate reductase [Shewanella sp. Isolate7]|uniref:pyrroline-5-carboxylate reductase n=1 Tax=Shewanella sp. Isolate7 TaxID=2908528 RepID=UPI001EFCE867|nr:pyrroline-5-carboxylate reductase [Shewanella sp. Isolate7]MCG9723435.1 pyrroline-5-carboxylate reductase [Shewanella sp. Isolate7]